MDVKAINNVSLQQSFEGKPRKTENKGINEYPQMDAPLSKNGAKAMRESCCRFNVTWCNRWSNFWFDKLCKS